MKRKLMLWIVLCIMMFSGCKKSEVDEEIKEPPVEVATTIEIKDEVLLDVVEKYSDVEFKTEGEVESIRISDYADNFREKVDSSNAETIEEDVDAFCNKMDKFLEKEQKAGRITEYEKNDFCYMVTFASGEEYGYTIPSLDNFLAGDVITMWPCTDDKDAKDANGAKEAATHIADLQGQGKIISNDFSTKSSFAESIEPWLNLKSGDIVIIESHGNWNDKTNSQICIGQKFTEEDIFSYSDKFSEIASVKGLKPEEFGLGTEKFFSKFNPRAHVGKQYFDVFINEKFFDFFYEEGDLEGTIFYIGTCYSLYDNKLASKLCSLGASAVIGYDAKVYVPYEVDACKQVFELLSEGFTVSDAVELTRDILVEKYAGGTFHSAVRDIKGYNGVIQCYPADCDVKLTTFEWEDDADDKVTNEPKLEKINLGNFNIIYDDSYVISDIKGKTPEYETYYKACERFPNSPDVDSLADDAIFGSHSNFEYEGCVAPLWFYMSTEKGKTEDNAFLFECAADEYGENKKELWGNYYSLPQSVRESLDATIDKLKRNICLNEVQMRACIFGADEEETAYEDGYGRSITIFNTPEDNLMMIDVSGTYNASETETFPFEHQINFSVETDTGTEKYVLELSSVAITQVGIVDLIYDTDTVFSVAGEALDIFSSNCRIEATLYVLPE